MKYLGCNFITTIAFLHYYYIFFFSFLSSPSISSSVHLCTASLHGSATCTCPCWIDCMSTTPLNSPVVFSFVRTTAPMKLSSSKCLLSLATLSWVLSEEAERDGGLKLYWVNICQTKADLCCNFSVKLTWWFLLITETLRLWPVEKFVPQSKGTMLDSRWITRQLTVLLLREPTHLLAGSVLSSPQPCWWSVSIAVSSCCGSILQ